MISISHFFLLFFIVIIPLFVLAIILFRREKAKAAIAEDERNIVLNNISVAFVHLDKDYVVQWESSRVLGGTITRLRKYIVGEVCYKTVYGRSEPCEHCPMSRVYENGNRSTYIDTAGEYTLKLTAIPLQNDNEKKVSGGVLQVEDITAQITQERIQREVKEAMEFSLQATNAVTWEIDTKNRVLFAPSLKLKDSEKTKTIDAYIAERIHPDHQAEFAREINLLLTGEKPYVDIVAQAYFSLGDKDTYEWIHTKGKALNPDENGQYTRVFGTQQLVTEEVLRQKELKETYAQMEFSLQATRSATWDVDIKTQILSSPDLILKESKKKGELSTYITECIHPDYQANFAWEMERLMKGKIPYMDNVSLARFALGSKTEYDWVHTKGQAANPDGNGQYTKVFGTQQLVTEEVLRRKELEETTIQLEMTFEAAQLSPWELDLETEVFSSIDSTVIEGRGITLDEYKRYFHTDDLQVVDDAIYAIRRNQSDSLSMQVRISLPGDKEGERWFEFIGKVSQRDSNMKPTRLIGIRRDIMHLKRADELVRLRNKAEESNRLMSAFLANMSHEIRTPLNAIVGFSNLISNVETEEEKDHFLQIIESNNEYLLQLINDILDISKIESGKLDLDYASFSLNKLFEEQKDTFQLRLDPSVDIVFEQTGTDFVLFSDERRIKQVLINILSNALKYTTEGKIAFGYKVEDAQLYVYVTDTGCGIPEDKLPIVFDRFVKIDSFKQGTGLGLFICKSIIDSLGGQIGVQSTLREGSTFWFTIPALLPSDFENS